MSIFSLEGTGDTVITKEPLWDIAWTGQTWIIKTGKYFLEGYLVETLKEHGSEFGLATVVLRDDSRAFIFWHKNGDKFEDQYGIELNRAENIKRVRP